MEPVYFPFTYVSPSASALFGACFRRTAVYQPLSETVSPALKDMAEAGRFEIRVPVDTDTGRLMNLLNEYQAWAKLHEGRDLKFFTTQGDRVPFFDDAAAHRLSTDIRQRAAGTDGSPPADPLFDARVFLALAQEFDRRQGDFQNGLAAYREMEQKLIQDLKGDPEAPVIGLGGGPALWAEEPGGHMTEKRLEAFSRLAREEETDDRLFITTSRAVFDAALEKIGGTEEVLRIERMPFPEKEAAAAFQSELTAHLTALLENPSAHPETVTFPRAGGGTKQLSLTLRRAGVGRAALLNACMTSGPAADFPDGPADRAILIGFLEGAA